MRISVNVVFKIINIIFVQTCIMQHKEAARIYIEKQTEYLTASMLNCTLQRLDLPDRPVFEKLLIIMTHFVAVSRANGHR